MIMLMTTIITIIRRWVSGSADVSVPSYDQGSRTLVDSFYHCFLLSWWSPYFSRWWYLTLRMLKLQCVCCHLFWIQLFAPFDQMVDQIYHLEAGDTLEVVAALLEGCAAHHILSLTIPTSNSINQSCNHTINPSLNQLSIQWKGGTTTLSTTWPSASHSLLQTEVFTKCSHTDALSSLNIIFNI